MDRYERLQTIDRLRAEITETEADMAARRERQLAGEPDALEEWRANMPTPRPRAAPLVSKAELLVRALRVEVEQHHRAAARFRREVKHYREELEKALGKVIADQRRELAVLREEIDNLRAERVRTPRLVGHAISA